MNCNKTIGKFRDCSNRSCAMWGIKSLDGAIKDDFRDFEAILFVVSRDLEIYKPFHLGNIYF